MRPEPLKVVSREGKLWPALASGLHGPRRAFVWWQGESDSTPDLLASYELKLVNLIARVRQENGDPTLLVVLVKVILNRNQPIRDAETRIVEHDPNAVLVDVDDLPVEGGTHVV